MRRAQTKNPSKSHNLRHLRELIPRNPVPQPTLKPCSIQPQPQPDPPPHRTRNTPNRLPCHLLLGLAPRRLRDFVTSRLCDQIGVFSYTPDPPQIPPAKSFRLPDRQTKGGGGPDPRYSSVNTLSITNSATYHFPYWRPMRLRKALHLSVTPESALGSCSLATLVACPPRDTSTGPRRAPSSWQVSCCASQP